MKKLVAVLAAAIFMAVPALGIAALAGPNTVNSAAIIDGSVATADIANLAVTGAKITNGAVTATQLANGAVTSAKLATGAVASGNLVDGSVTTSKIADGAVTDAKIAGPISTSKLNVGTAAGTIAAGDHSHDAIYQKKYGSVAVVALSGGDYSSPETALGDISTWCSVEPCLVKVMPGTYTSSSNGLSGIAISKFVTLEGSGEGSTNIICGNMTLYNDGEIRSLTITSPLPINAYYTPVAPPYANSTGPAIVRNVTLNTVSNDDTGVINYNANLELTNVKINVTGSGNGTGTALNSMFNFTKLNNVTMSLPSGGTAVVSSAYSNVYIANSAIIAPTTSTALSFGSYPGAIFVNNSQIQGQIVPAGGMVKCVGAFNANYDPIACQ